MADLTFADSHNMVAYLEKSEDNADFAEIVDFLNASPIRYALTVSLTVYVSYIEQFWSTAKIKTVNNETQIRAKVDGKTIVITESSVRRDLHFNDEDADETNHEEKEDMCGNGATTATSLDAEQFIGNIHRTPIHDNTEKILFLEGIDSGGSPRRQDTMGDRPAQTRVLDLENVKDAQALEIKKLKKRVKKTRKPDIMFAVCAYARFQVTSKVSHFHYVKRIFRYLKGQPKLGLWYPKDSPFDLEAYSNSDYAGASLDRKSTIGGCQFLRSRLISWQCKKQTIVSDSTTEA
ncbi:hypothetical protein Tco_0217010 [Tanacetum coccineum]